MHQLMGQCSYTDYNKCQWQIASADSCWFLYLHLLSSASTAAATAPWSALLPPGLRPKFEFEPLARRHRPGEESILLRLRADGDGSDSLEQPAVAGSPFGLPVRTEAAAQVGCLSCFCFAVYD